MISSALFTLALAVCAFAFPARPARPAARHAPKGRPAQPARNNTAHHPVAEGADYNPTIYSINWSGAVYNYQYPAGTWQTVTGTFNMPVPGPGNQGTQSYYSAAAWVGIDGGFQCEQAIWQIGVSPMYYEDGSVHYWPWYEWYPAYMQYFDDFYVAPGDTITATVTATSTTSGTGSLYNARSGQTATIELSGQPALCLQTAEWIVEDWTSYGQYVPFADFGTISFTNTSATTLGGQTVDATAATLVQMVDNNWDSVATASVTPAGVDVIYDL